MKKTKRRTYQKRDLIEMVSKDLSEINLSPRLVEIVVSSYISCKRQLLLEGGFIVEDGLSTAELLTRRVSERFSDKRFTVKLKESIDYAFQNEAMEKLTNNEDFRDIMEFTLPDEE